MEFSSSNHRHERYVHHRPPLSPIPRISHHRLDVYPRDDLPHPPPTYPPSRPYPIPFHSVSHLRPPPPPSPPLSLYSPHRSQFNLLDAHSGNASSIDNSRWLSHRLQSPSRRMPFDDNRHNQDCRLSRIDTQFYDPESPILKPFINRSPSWLYTPSDSSYNRDFDYKSGVGDGYSDLVIRDDIRRHELSDIVSKYGGGADNYGPNSTWNSSDLRAGLGHRSASNSRPYGNLYGSGLDNEPFLDDAKEDERWIHSRQLPLGMESHYRDSSHESLFSSGGRGPYVHGSDKFLGWKKEGKEKFVHIPKKQVQKKNALRRIRLGKSSNRNRYQDLNSFTGNFDRNNAGTSRGREKNFTPHSKMKFSEMEKKSSAVELDVSFESNVLVAKAIENPFNSAADSERNLIFRNRNTKKATVSESPASKAIEVSLKLDSSVQGPVCPSGNGQALMTSEKFVVSDGESLCVVPVQVCSSGTHDPAASTEAEGSANLPDHNDKISGSIGSSGTPVRRIRKRNTTAFVSEPSNNQLATTSADTRDENCLRGQSGHSQPGSVAMLSEEKFNSEVLDVLHDIVLESSSGDQIESKMVESLVPACKDIAYFDSYFPCISDPKENKCNSTEFFDICSTPIPGISADNTHTSLHESSSVLNAGKILRELHDTAFSSSFDKVDDVGTQHYQNEDSSIPETDHVKVSTEGPFYLDGAGNFDMPRPNEITSHNEYDASTSDYAIFERQVDTHSDMASIDQQHTLFKSMVLPENTQLNEPQNPTLSKGIDSIYDFSSAEDVRSQDSTPCVSDSNIDSGNTSGFQNSPSFHKGNMLASKTDCSLQPFRDRGAVTPEDGIVERYSNTDNLVDTGFDIDNTPRNRAKRRLWNTKNGLSNVMVAEMQASCGTHIPFSDTTLTCHLNGSTASKDKEVESGSSTPVHSVRGMDVSKIGQCNISKEVHAEVYCSVMSPSCRKKRKLLSPVRSSSTYYVHEGPVVANTSVTFTERPSIIIEKKHELSENKMITSTSDTFCSTGLLQHSNSVMVLTENIVSRGSPQAKMIGDEFKRHDFPCSSSQEAEGKENCSMSITLTTHHSKDLKSESRECVHAVKESDMLCVKASVCRSPAESETQNLNKKLEISDVGCDGYLLEKARMAPASSNLLPSVDGSGNSALNSSIQLIDSLPDSLSSIGPPENLSGFSGLHLLNTVSPSFQMPNKKNCNDQRIPSEFSSDVSSLSVYINKSSDKVKINVESGQSVISSAPVNDTAILFLPEGSRGTMCSLNSSGKVLHSTNNSFSSAVAGGFTGHSFSVASRRAPPSVHMRKPRTWHRMANLSASVVPFSGIKSSSNFGLLNHMTESAVVQSSYIRKGNSLVRQASPASSVPFGSQVLTSSGGWVKPLWVDETKKIKVSESSAEIGFASLEKPSACPQSNMSKLVSSSSISNEDLTTLERRNLMERGCVGDMTHPLCVKDIDNRKSIEDANKTDEILEDGPSINFEGHLVDERNLVKKVTYVKRKSNQLVAASNTSSQPLQEIDQGQGYNAYYKRRKNQLIRSSLETHTMKTAAGSDSNVNLEGQRACNIFPSKSASKRLSVKDVAKVRKPSKLSSLVWTLYDTDASKGDASSSRRRNIWTHLFPWKRATLWRNFKRNSVSTADNGSLSTISQKLLLSRKRDAIYTRSVHGFSLRISKVLGVGGTSLKWSKSIEKNSKQANEEATLAVAAEEKRKREQNGARAFTKTKSRSTREWIFCIGSFRYKMDPTRRALQRISDAEKANSVDPQSGRISNIPYVPKRLVIGNDEYVRIGNGNQLIRDPKKRTRILASEKVRWSLHTARLRLARKRKYCQFFTRFGKCNKDDGKCPYIHDPSKIAVCTKFLSGSCSNTRCKLTHKVIPERMQDCSYYLQGLCSNENCPYRHVNVNPNASICEGFLRGHCADGNECRKKHTYVCPGFKATGICPHGSKCKLHHPKNRKEGMKEKAKTRIQKKSTRGRYFGSKQSGILDYGAATPEKHSAEDDVDIFCQDGKFTDYISLDSSDEESVGVSGRKELESMCYSDADSPDLLVADPFELTKPVNLLKNIREKFALSN